jgi:glycosyltransferase involved in cell wall biosynthesis
LSQNFDDFELIINDNKSTDGTESLCRAYEERDPRIKYFRNTQHVTATENFNIAYERSDKSTRYVAMLASDDWWDRSYLSRMVGILERTPNATFVHCDAYLTDEDGTVTGRLSDAFPRIMPPPGLHGVLKDMFLTPMGCVVHGETSVISRRKLAELWGNGPLLDPKLRLVPDYDLWLQLFCRGAMAVWIDEPLGYYRKHIDAMTMPHNSIPRLLEEVQILETKLEGVCPPELEEVRLIGRQNRLAQLGFEMLANKQPREAFRYLERAWRVSPRSRLDIRVARWLSMLPVSASIRAGLWHQTLRLHRIMRNAP